MVKRFLESVDYRFWVILAYWLGLKISFGIGILLTIVLVNLGVAHAAIILAMFLPMVIWSAWVFKNMEMFAKKVKQLLRLD